MSDARHTNEGAADQAAPKSKKQKKREYYLKNQEREKVKARERRTVARAKNPKLPLRKTGPRGGNSAYDRLDKSTGLGYYLTLFLNAKATRSEQTVENYRRVLGQFGKFIANRWPVAADDIDAYLAVCKRSKCSEATVDNYYRHICSFFNWLERREKLDGRNPISLAERPPYPKQLPRVPKLEDVQKLRFHFEARAKSGEWQAVRNLALFCLLFDAGLRVGEVVGLDFEDLDFDANPTMGGSVILRNTKSRADGTAYFGPGVAEHIAKWFEARRKLPLPGELDQVIFITHERERRWRRITHWGIRNMLREACKLADCRPISPHKLRHACAVFSMRAGADLLDVQKQLRHRTPQMTYRYVMVNDFGRAKRHAGYSPFANLGGAK